MGESASIQVGRGTKRQSCWLCLLFALLAWPVQAETHTRRMVISYFEHPQIDKYKQLIASSYRQLGIVPRFVAIEGERAMMSVDSGLVDAELIGDKFVVQDYPNMVAVGPVLAQAQVFLLCRKPKPCSLDVLQNPNNDIVLESLLWQSAQHALSVPVKAQLSVFPNPKALLTFLHKKRANYAIYGFDTDAIPQEFSSWLTAVPLYSLEMHHYVNRKYAPLFDALATRISQQLPEANSAH